MPRQRLAPLTSVRFFAAAAIVGFHMHGKWGLPSARETGLALGVGVDLFFVLSGFILAYTYREIFSAGHGFRIIAYRIARIWPLHLAVLGLFFLLAYDPGNAFHQPAQLLASVFLVQAWFGDYTYTFAGNALAWTLSVEFFFYLSFPLLTLLSSRMLGLVTLAVSLVALTWASLSPPSAGLAEQGVSAGAILRTHPTVFFILFVSGMLAARLFLSREWSLERRTASMLEIAALLAAIGFFLYHRQISTGFANLVGIDGPAKQITHIALGAVFFAPLIFILAIGRGIVSDALSWRPLIILGEASFALYLLHQVVQTGMVEASFSSNSYIPVYLAVVVGGSLLLFRFVEKPSNRFLRSKIDALASPVLKRVPDRA